MLSTLLIPPTIKFEAAHWRWATWRPYTPLPREIPPFDQVKACERFAKLASDGFGP